MRGFEIYKGSRDKFRAFFKIPVISDGSRGAKVPDPLLNYVMYITNYFFLFFYVEESDEQNTFAVVPNLCVFFLIRGARCSSVVRAFAHGAMVRRIDPS